MHQMITTSAEDRLRDLLPLAAKNFAEAQKQIGDLLAQGLTGPPDYAAAMHWWLLAAKQRHAAAEYNLAVQYALGHGVPVNDRRAVLWLLRAYRDGYLTADRLLGTRYVEGRGVRQSNPKAYYYLKLSATRGDTLAAGQLAALRRKMSDSDFAACVAYYRSHLASTKGVPSAETTSFLSETNIEDRLFRSHMLIAETLRVQGTLGHSDDNPNASPRPFSFGDFYLKRLRYKPPMPHCQWFLLYAQDIQPDCEEGACVSGHRIWDLMEPGDEVLLSDGITHHITMVARVDRCSEWLALVDAWPLRCFLNPYGNVTEIKAVDVRCKGGLLLSIRRTEFLRVIKGIVMLRPLAFPSRVFARWPDVANVSNLVSFAIGFMANDSDEAVAEADELLNRAVAAIDASTTDQEATRLINQRTYCGLLMKVRRLMEQVKEKAEVATAGCDVEQGMEPEAYLSLSETQVENLADALMTTGHIQACKTALTVLKARGVQHDKAQVLACKYAFVTKDYANCITECSRALELLDRKTELSQSATEPDPYDDLRNAYRFEIRRMRCIAYSETEAHDQAAVDGEAALAIFPNRTDVMDVLIDVYRKRNDMPSCEEMSERRSQQSAKDYLEGFIRFNASSRSREDWDRFCQTFGLEKVGEIDFGGTQH